jgi:hypothetical protein
MVNAKASICSNGSCGLQLSYSTGPRKDALVQFNHKPIPRSKETYLHQWNGYSQLLNITSTNQQGEQAEDEKMHKGI